MAAFRHLSPLPPGTRRIAGLDLSFDHGQPPSAVDGTFTQVAGRRALVRPEAEARRPAW